MTVVAAFDWGGTWIRAGLVDDSGEIVVQHRVRCPERPQDQLSVVTTLVNGLSHLSSKSVDAVGVGIAGIVRNGRVISGSNLGLKGVDLQADLERQLRLPVRVVIDTQAAALAELSVCGPKQTAVFMSVGTGIGGAVVYDGSLFLVRVRPETSATCLLSSTGLFVSAVPAAASNSSRPVAS